jgi:tetratricopeptide (TPR) repeat protein
MVWSTVGTRYEQIGKYADAQRCLEKTIELAPNNLPARFELFDLALKQGDDAGMRRAQSRILEIVKSESDPGYVLSEVKRRMVGQQTGASTPEELKEARQMLDAAIKQRSNYADLYVSSGQLYMLLENNPDEAMASFKKAIELGANNLTAIAIEIRLLAERGRIAEARKLMDRIPSQAWTAVLDRTAAEVLLAVGDSDRAYAEAEKIAKAKSEDPATQVWFADLAAGRLPQQRVASTDGNAAPKTPHPEAAETALKKAISLNRSDPELWTRLVTLYLQLKRPEDVEKTLREAHLALDEEYLPMLIAKYYELQSRWQEAEDIYLAIYAGRPADDVFVARRMAEFYLTWASKNEANKGKAAVYLNRILRAANEGKLGKDDPSRPWARIQAAKLLAATGDYVDSVKAEKLLASAMEKGMATPEIEDLLVDVLSNRQDPTSRERAVALLRQIRQKRGLTWSREVLMGDLLNQLGDWEGAKKQMEQAIGRFPKQYEVETAYISMLIQHKEFPAAELRITRLSSNKDAQPGLGQLRLNLAAAQGKKDVVRSTLTGMTPNLKGAISEKQLKFLRELSILADSVGDHEYALTLMGEYARRAKGSELEFARLTALYGDIDEGFTMLRALMNTNMDDVIQIAIEVLRARRAEAPDKLDEEVGRIVRQGLRDDPESAKRLIIEAEMLEVQEKFPESIEAYKRILARDDVPPRIRAGAANNMAFLVALQGAKKEDLTLALKYVNQAIDVMGPISDILDTRALIYISLGQFADAVADMQMAVKMNITPSKYFHLAEAQLGAGDQKGAKATWELAKQQGFKPESVPKPEQGRLQQFMKQMESVALTPQL